MAETDHESVAAHPIAPRMRNGPKDPHVGPTREDYHKHHAMTIGEHSDKWWSKVSITLIHPPPDQPSRTDNVLSLAPVGGVF